MSETSKAKKLLQKLIEVDKVINSLSNGSETLNRDSLASIGSLKTAESVGTGGTSSLRPVIDEGRSLRGLSLIHI